MHGAVRATAAHSGVNALTYCTNIHAGESWMDAMRNLELHALAVKQAVSAQAAFPLGLRISAQAAQELDDVKIAAFRDWCEKHDCHILTVNGFPHGAFHGRSVKQAVYQPDWRHPERLRYTCRLADLLSRMATVQCQLSISTVPIAYRPDFTDDGWPAVRAHVITALTHLDRIRQRGGPMIRLALEPEPMCVLETISDAVGFWNRMDLPEALSDLLALCLDCCHQAVEFESPASCLQMLSEACLPIAKVQVSSALRASSPQEIAGVLTFNEATYLHQVVARTREQEFLRFEDLPAFARCLQERQDVEECRVHFHVPIFLDHLGVCGTTRFFLEDLLPRLAPDVTLEVETYSFEVLPLALRRDTVSASLARELTWARQALHA